MGVIYVDATVRNPADRSRSWQGHFLVDTGATHTVVPRRHLEFIGLQPEGIRTFQLADGTEVAMDLAPARLELMGEFASLDVVYGDDDAEPLLGVIALESAGFEVDPVHRQLRKSRVLPLKEACA